MKVLGGATIRNLKIGRNGDSYLLSLKALDEDTFKDFKREFAKNKNLDRAIKRSYDDDEFGSVEKFFTGYTKTLNKKFKKNFTTNEILDWILFTNSKYSKLN